MVEDALRHLHAAAEHGRQASVESLAGALGVSTRRAAELARTLHERGLAVTEAGLRLAPAGERWARSVVRAHRLWESHLADEVGTRAVDLHRLADRKEHRLEPGEVERLDARLGYPERDPHGDPIPTTAGELRALTAVPLTVLPEGASGEIVHLEDEPEAVYAKLVELGLEPGQTVLLRDSSAGRISFEVSGRRCELPAVDAANVFVTPLAGPPPPAGGRSPISRWGRRRGSRRSAWPASGGGVCSTSASRRARPSRASSRAPSASRGRTGSAAR